VYSAGGRSWDPDYETLYWNGSGWAEGEGAHEARDYKVLGWYPLPGAMEKEA
jgi:hypothetical protein